MNAKVPVITKSVPKNWDQSKNRINIFESNKNNAAIKTNNIIKFMYIKKDKLLFNNCFYKP